MNLSQIYYEATRTPAAKLRSSILAANFLVLAGYGAGVLTGHLPVGLCLPIVPTLAFVDVVGFASVKGIE